VEKNETYINFPIRNVKTPNQFLHASLFIAGSKGLFTRIPQNPSQIFSHLEIANATLHNASDAAANPCPADLTIPALSRQCMQGCTRDLSVEL
jgi:hypothetical protein